MIFHQLLNEESGCLSYLTGCPQPGRPAWVHPGRHRLRDRVGAAGADDLWEALRRVLLPLPDGVEVYAGHGAGSACGRAMSEKAAWTIGFERRFNPAFRFDSKARFVDFIMEGVPPKPAG